MAEADDFDLDVMDLDGMDDDMVFLRDDDLDDHHAPGLPFGSVRLPSNFRCDGISSLVALAFQLKVPIFSGGLLGTKSGAAIRIGSGAFSVANLSRHLSDMLPEEYSWWGELDEAYTRRPAGGKVVIKGFTAGDIEQRRLGMQQLGQELRILAHPCLMRNDNIVKLLGLDWEGLPFDTWGKEYRCPRLLLEYADCGTLDDFFHLDGIEYTWDVKVGLLHDITNGLEGLDDAGVCHGDLKPANVLVFRTGLNSFRAKICDFGTAVVSIDFDEDQESTRLNAFTLPWEAPEAADDIPLDSLDRVDLYSLGLLAYYIALEGQEPFTAVVAGFPLPTDPASRQSTLKEWKREDKLLEFCKAAVRDVARGRHVSVQESILSEIFNMTLRADPQKRAEQYSDIKALLKPEETVQLNQEYGPGNMAELVNFFSESQIRPYFDSDPKHTIPEIERCWQRFLPRSIIAAQIFDDLERIASQLLGNRLEFTNIPRAAEATYALSLCLIQGFGCDVNLKRAEELLVRSVLAGCATAERYIYRLLGGLTTELPEPLRDVVAQNAEMAVVMFRDMKQAQDLLHINPTLYESAMLQKKTNNGPGIEYFGADIWDGFQVDDPKRFLDMVGQSNSEIEDEYLLGTGLTWLHYAASRGSPGAVEALLSTPCCDVNCLTADGGWTPLFMACQAGHYEVAMLLLDQGADPTIRTQQGGTCLHQIHEFDTAVAGTIAGRLVCGGLSVDIKNTVGKETPLATVCFALGGCDSSAIVVKALIDLGADPMERTGDGYSCVDIAAMQLDAGALDALLQSSLLVAEKGEEARAHALRVLMSKPLFYRLRIAGWSYETRLRAVVQALAIPQVLEAYKAMDPNHTPLYDACHLTAVDLIPLIFEAGYGTEVFHGRHPLLASIKNNQAEVVKTLMVREADPSAIADPNGWNILHYAAFYFPAILSHFLSQLQRRGCDVRSLVNAGCANRGFTPFDVAIHADNFESADMLLECGAQYTEFTRRGDLDVSWDRPLFSSLHHACTSRRRLSYLLGLSEHPSLVVSSTGLTIFHLVAGEFEIEWASDDPSPAKSIGFLLEHYATKEQANQNDDMGTTPLHLAALMMNVAVAVELIELAEVDVNPRDSNGRTPLDLLDLYESGALEKLKESTYIAEEVARLTPKDDMDRRLRDRRLKAMRELLEKHGALSGNLEQ